jgi:predicted nucleic acid-binding protein
VIALDTSVLIEAVGAGGAMRGELRQVIAGGERVVLPSIVLYEWLRGPRLAEELEAQSVLFPSSEAIPFGADEVRIAAQLYQSVRRPRGRELDLAIAACALSWDASLWTLNRGDFEDLPGLRLS